MQAARAIEPALKSTLAKTVNTTADAVEILGFSAARALTAVQPVEKQMAEPSLQRVARVLSGSSGMTVVDFAIYVPRASTNESAESAERFVSLLKAAASNSTAFSTMLQSEVVTQNLMD